MFRATTSALMRSACMALPEVSINPKRFIRVTLSAGSSPRIEPCRSRHPIARLLVGYEWLFITRWFSS